MLLTACLLVVACQDDFDVENNKVLPGQEIQFGGKAYFESDDSQTRTEYGDVVQIGTDENGDPIYGVEVKWVSGQDSIDIACPQAAGLKNAQYRVGGDINLDETTHTSIAQTLNKTTAVGLQWAGQIAHNFCAVYPSVEKIKKRVLATHADKMALTVTGENVTLKGYVPSTQPAKSVVEVKEGDKLLGYTVNPDMTYAYMVANKRTKPSTSPIGLDFNSIVTAVQFKIFADEIKRELPHSKETPEDEIPYEEEDITIMAVSVEYASDGVDLSTGEDVQIKRPICGLFTYDFNNGNLEYDDYDPYSDFDESRVQAVFDPITLSENQYIDLTFFLLLKETLYGTGELQLKVYYKTSAGVEIKSARIQKDLEAQKKYFVKDVKLPPVIIEADAVSGRTWWSMLPEKALFSEISLPVAGNVFANTIYGANEENSQQVKKLEDLWDAGVRGFEFVNQSTATDDSWGNAGDGLLDAPFVCAEAPLTNAEHNFGTAFTYLTKQLRENPTETLVLICTYMAANDGFTPNQYVTDLITYLDAFTSSEAKRTDVEYKFTKDKFVQLKSSTTVQDLKGKIAIIIRPGDDSRYQSEDVTTVNGVKYYTNGILLGDWASNMLLIQDWGTAFDVWDRRYNTNDKKYYREASFKQYAYYTGTLNEIEPWLYAMNQTNTMSEDNKTSNNYFNKGNAFPTAQTFDFAHNITGVEGAKAYIQEWARVAPKNETLNTIPGVNALTRKFGGREVIFVGYVGGENYNIWTSWPESITEKKQAIKDLFNKSVAQRGKSSNDLYINVLSGYYIDWEGSATYKLSLLPFKHDTQYSGTKTENATNQGKGGNFKLLAYELNKYVYDLIYNKQLNQEGPLGLVVMDHIGNTSVKKLGSTETETVDDKSLDLVDLIMMQNFKFTLKEKAQ